MFLIGAILGGFIASHFLSDGNPVQISENTIADLSKLGISAPTSAQPDELFSIESLFTLNRKQTVDLLIFNESFDFISFPIFLPCNKKLQEHWVIKLNIQTIK